LPWPSDGSRSPTIALRWAGVAAVILLFCWAQPGPAAAAAGTEVQGQARAELLARIKERQQGIQSLRATVVQRRRNPLLRDEAVSEGILLFQRPNRLRWEVTRPQRVIILIDGYTLLTYRPDQHEAERRDLREDFPARAAVGFLTAAMDLDLAELEKRFQLDVLRDAGGTVLRLTPRSPLVAQAVASVAISLPDGDSVPRMIVVTGQKGDRAETTLSHVTVNPSLPGDAFVLKLGPEVRVRDSRQPAGEVPGGR
jgi:outer membrane lipoprotein carrier protein